MQKISRIYFRKRMGVDYRVWLTLLVTAIISLILLGFRLATTERCHAIQFALKGTMDHRQKNNYYTGEHIKFIAKMAHAAQIQWDFGDGSAVVTGNPVAHSYKYEGNFLITVLINGRCRESLTVQISQPSFTNPLVRPIPENGTQVIRGKDYAVAGELSIYQTDEVAQLYEWSIEDNSDFPTKNGSKVAYSFTEPGRYRLQLKLDSDPSKVYHKTIIVSASGAQAKGAMPDELPPLPLPAPKGPDVPSEPNKANDGASESGSAKKFEIIPNQIFKDNFQAIVEGSGTIEDIAKYLCEGVNTKVRGNGKTFSTLALFCEELKGKKGMLGLGGKRKIKSVNAKREMGSNCVYWLDVTYK